MSMSRQVVTVSSRSAFEQRSRVGWSRSITAIRQAGVTMRVVAAPMGLQRPMGWELGDWLPNADGLAMTRWALHEWLGRLAGA